MHHALCKLCIMNCALCIVIAATAQNNNRIAFPEGNIHLYRLVLKDKNGTKGTLKHPEQYLSQKSLARRSRQGISVDETDLPVSEKYLQAIARENLHIVSKSKWNNTVVVKAPGSHDPARLPQELKALPFVTQVIEVLAAPDVH